MNLKEENSDFVYLGKRIDKALNYIQHNELGLVEWFKQYVEIPYQDIVFGELDLEEEDYIFSYLDSLLDDMEEKFNIIFENKMTKETLRMQMLSGIITESEYAAAINQEIEETEKNSLNEHAIGGIVGIGAINQIPSRAKADYEDAFEYFLSQKYPLNEADEATAVGEKVEAAVEDKLEATVDNLSDEQKDQLRAELAKAGITADSRIEDVAGKLDESLYEAEGDTKAKVASALSDVGGGLMKSLLVPIIPVAIGSMGPGVAAGFVITAAVAGGLIALAKLLGAEKSMEEGKEVEEPYNY